MVTRMTTSWHSLFLTSAEDADAAQIREKVTNLHYTLYDPFGLIPGRAYTHSVRCFVAPTYSGWTRLLFEAPVPALIPTLSEHGPALMVSMDENGLDVRVYEHGREAADPAEAMAAVVRPGKTTDDLRSALNAQQITVIDPEQKDDALPLDVLPADMQSMAATLNPQQTSKMFEKIAGQFLKQNAEQSKAAREILQRKQINWNGPDGWRVRAIMDCLTIPEPWQTPDFVTLRNAYSLHKRRERKPDARLYPGDAEAMDAVPDALAYTPVYAGKDA